MTPVTSTSGGAAAAVASFLEHPVSATASNGARMIKYRWAGQNREVGDRWEFGFSRWSPKGCDSGSTRMGTPKQELVRTESLAAKQPLKSGREVPKAMLSRR